MIATIPSWLDHRGLVERLPPQAPINIYLAEVHLNVACAAIIFASIRADEDITQSRRALSAARLMARLCRESEDGRISECNSYLPVRVISFAAYYQQ